MIVVDASVAVKWLVSEPGSAAAAEVLEEAPSGLFAPALIRIEVANGIVRHLRRGDISQAKAEAACAAWDRLLEDGVITLTPDMELMHEAVRIAIDIRHTVPDCLYVVLAMRLNATVITADVPFYERGRKVHGDIHQLKLAA